MADSEFRTGPNLGRPFDGVTGITSFSCLADKPPYNAVAGIDTWRPLRSSRLSLAGEPWLSSVVSGCIYGEKICVFHRSYAAIGKAEGRIRELANAEEGLFTQPSKD